MQKITPFLWFNDNAKEAGNFYTSIFRNSKILSISQDRVTGPGPKGIATVASFQLEGQIRSILLFIQAQPSID